MRFSEILREKRLNAGMTQEELGRRLNKTKNNISQYELNKRQPDYDVLAELGRIFSCSIDELLGFDIHSKPALLREETLPAQKIINVYMDSPDEKPCGSHLPPPCCIAGKRYFYLHAPDDSLREERILRGDLLLICKDSRPENDSIVVFYQQGKIALRRLTCCPNGMLLLTNSGGGAPIYVSKESIDLIGYVAYVEFTPFSLPKQ